ncbi:hypothetical protein LEMLEM_LOCUS459 [Lemmus lemmus]
MQKSDAGLQTQAALLQDPCHSYWDLLTHLCTEKATIQLMSFPFLLAQLTQVLSPVLLQATSPSH